MSKYRLLIGAVAMALLMAQSGWGQGPGAGPPQGPGGGGFPQGPSRGGVGPGQDGGGFRQRGGGMGGFGGGGFDPAQMFNRFTNGKDVWTQADANNNPWGQGMFSRITQAMNISNGQITREQFTTYMEQQRNNWGGGGGGGMGGGRRGNRQGPGGGFPGGGPGGGGTAPSQGGGNGPGNFGNGADQWAERMFQRYDTNGDGLLNKDEMPEALRAEIDKWDSNKDGFIDLTEFKAYFQADFQRRMAENGGWNPNWPGGGMTDPAMPSTPIEEEEAIKKAPVYRAGNLPQGIPSWFAQYDTDGDGQIGLYEWKASGESLEKFRQIDKNNDGFLTIDEVMRWTAEQNKNGSGTPSIGGNRFVANQGPGNGPRGGGNGGFQARGNGGGGQGRGNWPGGGRNRGNWPGGPGGG